MPRRPLVLAALVVFLSLVVGCGGGGGGAATGTLHVKITDAPFPIGDLDAAVVTVVSIEARGDAGWVDIKSDDTEPVDIDLYELRAGLSEELALVTVPTGAYDEIRLVISMAKITFTDLQGESHTQDFFVPSGAASGIKVKIEPPVLVAQDQTSALLLDVDLTGSFHVAGEGGEVTWDDLVGAKAIFHPVIRAINESEIGLLKGLVVDDAMLPLENVEVRAFPTGSDITAVEPTASTFSTPADTVAAPGSYALALDPGFYDVYIRLPDTEDYLSVRSNLQIQAGDVLDEELSPPLP